MADKTPATLPNPLDVLKKIDEDLKIMLAPQRRIDLVLELLNTGKIESANDQEKRLLLLDPDFMYIFSELKKREADFALLTKGMTKMAEYLDSEDQEKVLAAYDRLQKRQDKGPLVAINIGTRSYEDTLNDSKK